MNALRKEKFRPVARDVFERLSQRLEELAERQGRYSNAERIALLRRVMFGDEDVLQESGTVVIPK